MSHPAWVCGLKHYLYSFLDNFLCHTLRGCVDWNQQLTNCVKCYLVTPCVGVWIETFLSQKLLPVTVCHTLRGCVDWNLSGGCYPIVLIVTPCVGVWIETISLYFSDPICIVTPCVGVWIETLQGFILPFISESHPAWVCGLKHCATICKVFHLCHTLRGCVDWNHNCNI